MKLTNSKTQPYSMVIYLVLSVLFGFFIADMIYLVLGSSGLLVPDHWFSLLKLALSGIVLYGGIGFFYLGFVIVVFMLSRLIRQKLSWAFLAVIALVGAPVFLGFQNLLQGIFWGWKVSPKSAMFYFPTLISIVVLAGLIMVAQSVSHRSVRWSIWIRKIFGFPWIALPFAATLIIYALYSGIPNDVVKHFDEDVQRDSLTQHRLNQSANDLPESPNFIVLKIECLRADAFTQQNAPFLWGLAQENVNFSRYYVSAPATRPSVTSFFTSLYPVQHGCFNLALQEAAGEGVKTIRASRSVEALPMLLQENGYRTVMVTSNQLTKDMGFGFEDVFDRFDAFQPYHINFPYIDPFVGFNFLKRNMRYTRIFTRILFFSPEQSASYFIARRLNKTVIRELSRPNERPFFLYVHYIEPHSPYYEHPFKPIQLNLYIPSRRDNMVKIYESEIEEVDRQISVLFEHLRKSGQLENTYILITSDHGEEFYDHGNWGHGKALYPEVLHVPAILVSPSNLKQSKTVQDVVQSIDMAPTFAQIANIPIPSSWEGESVLPLLRPNEKNRVKLASLASNNIDLGNSRIAYSQFHDRGLFMASAITQNWQIILNERNTDQEFMIFSLSKDPQAKYDLADGNLETKALLTELLLDKLENLRKSASLYKGEVTEINPDQMNQLRDLGYTD